MTPGKLPQPPLLTEAEAAAFLSLKAETLATWRCTKRYSLPFIRVGRAIRYRMSDVEDFLSRGTVNGGANFDKSR